MTYNLLLLFYVLSVEIIEMLYLIYSLNKNNVQFIYNYSRVVLLLQLLSRSKIILTLHNMISTEHVILYRSE